MSLDSFFQRSGDQYRSYRDYLGAFKEQKKALVVCRRSIVLLTGAFAPLTTLLGRGRDSLRDVMEREIAVGDDITTTINAMTEQYGRELEPLLRHIERLVKRIETCRATKYAEITLKEHHDPLEFFRSLQSWFEKIAQDAARERTILSERDAFLYLGEAGPLAQASKIAYETFKTVGKRLGERQEHLKSTYGAYLANIELGKASRYIRRSQHELRLSSDALYAEVERDYREITHLFASSRVPLIPQRRIKLLEG